jgi:cysteine synthase A
MIYDSILEVIGKTPLVRLSRFGRGLPVQLLGKVEACNPGGSSKDRLALHLIDTAEAQGRLRPGDTIIEATAGNTGVGLAMIAAVRGYRLVTIVPHGTSVDKIGVVRALGAEIYECSADEEYEATARAMALNRNAFCPDQFGNPSNPESHARSTAIEIWEALEGRVDALVVVCGTGGTLAGVGRALRERDPEIALVRVLPVVAPGRGDSTIEGVAADGPPAEFACPGLSAQIEVLDEEARAAAQRLAHTEGILVGASSGAALAGAVRYAERTRPGANVVVILPDTGRNYLTRHSNAR